MQLISRLTSLTRPNSTPAPRKKYNSDPTLQENRGRVPPSWLKGIRIWPDKIMAPYFSYPTVWLINLLKYRNFGSGSDPIEKKTDPDPRQRRLPWQYPTVPASASTYSPASWSPPKHMLVYYIRIIGHWEKIIQGEGYFSREELLPLLWFKWHI